MRDCRVRPLLAVVAGTLVITGSGMLGMVDGASARAATCVAGVAGDVNGDGFGDLAVGAAGTGARPGSVHVLYGQQGRIVAGKTGSAPDDQRFDQDTPGIPGSSAANDRFGGTVAFGDFNADHCADLAIGADGDGRSGSVTVLYGTPKGLSTQAALRLVPDPYLGASDDARFGRSLAAADLDGDGVDDLAVGAPNLTLSGKARAGGVVVFGGSTAGLRSATGQAIAYTQDTPGVPGASGEDHRFGSSLAAGDFDGDTVAELAIGVPNGATTPGGVQIIRRSAANGRQPALITPDTPGVPGDAADITTFGQALAAGDVNADGRDDLAIGAPGTVPPPPADQVSGGAVFVLLGSGDGLTGRDSQVWTQNNVGVPDPEVDPHAFGAALTMGRFDAGPTDDLAIGEPYDELPTIDGGSVTVLFGGTSGLSATGSRYLHQGVRGVTGTVEDGDLFGASVASVVLARDGQQALVVGVPGEDLNGRKDVGRIHQFALGASGPQAAGSRVFDLGTSGVSGEQRAGAQFGIAANGPTPLIYPFED